MKTSRRSLVLLGTRSVRDDWTITVVPSREIDATVFVHGATGKGNDQCRFQLAAEALRPDVKIMAPWRMESYRNQFPGRTAMLEYCAKKNIPVKASVAKPYSSDENCLHISYEAGQLEDPAVDGIPIIDFGMTVSPQKAPNKETEITIAFESGVPVSVDGKKLAPNKLVARLNDIGGANGVGRIDVVETRFVGMKSRGVYEAPGMTALYAAHLAIEQLTLDRDTVHLRDRLAPEVAEMVYYGFWFSPERLALQALVEESQKNVRGAVRVKLYKGSIIAAGRKSPVSLYNPHIATMEADPTKAYNQDDATGFIRLNGLRLRVNSSVNGARNLTRRATRSAS